MASFESPGAGTDTGTIYITLPDGKITHLDDVKLAIVNGRCPLLAYAFELGYGGKAIANIEAESHDLVERFVYFLEEGSSYASKPDDEDPENVSLLLHLQMFYMGRNFDVPELQDEADLSMQQATVIALALPSPPRDLCDAIVFALRHLADNTSPFKHLIHYFILSYDKIRGDLEIAKLIYDRPDFHQALCKTLMERNYEDDIAAEIMQLPVCNPAPSSAAPLDGELDFYVNTDEAEDSDDADDGDVVDDADDADGLGQSLEMHLGQSTTGLCPAPEKQDAELSLAYRPNEILQQSLESSSIPSDGTTQHAVDHHPQHDLQKTAQVTDALPGTMELVALACRPKPIIDKPKEEERIEESAGSDLGMMGFDDMDLDMNTDVGGESDAEWLQVSPTNVPDNGSTSSVDECDSDTDWSLI
ncbi:hypothetical protein EJ04DRAFT_563698 [Polyplosphaeria fusca]|uniref:BTB domain-containing protein n=1 Tax=Polyplosphaeria fusca TaxID=682080 RepID=A0A9P4QYZ2_9PLEO|nr:hypothetical protein EJ04DRAFT_563698 [Polyplosphaeria fusca]